MRLVNLLLFVVAALLIAGCRPAAAPVSISNRPASINDVKQPKTFEEMSWTRFDGTAQRLGDLRGRVVILDFWATYCPPCIEEIPHLKALQEEYGPDKLQVIGLHVGGNEDKPKVPGFMARLNITYPLATPEDALTSAVLGTDSRIPQTAVFDKSGKMMTKVVGFDESIRDELDKAVAKAVNISD
jgi:Thiol-disulfide isomerase and thioredoxins